MCIPHNSFKDMCQVVPLIKAGLDGAPCGLERKIVAARLVELEDDRRTRPPNGSAAVGGLAGERQSCLRPSHQENEDNCSDARSHIGPRSERATCMLRSAARLPLAFSALGPVALRPTVSDGLPLSLKRV